MADKSSQINNKKQDQQGEYCSFLLTNVVFISSINKPI